MVDNVQPLPVREVRETHVVAAPFRRVSWGAILAGAVAAIIIQFALNMLGLSIGANTINPITEVNPVEPGLGTTAVIWFVASSIIAFFVGGMVAGRMAGLPEHVDGILHGVLAWGVAGLVSLAIVSSSIGNVFNTITGAMSQGIALAGQSLADVSPEVAEALNLEDASLQTILNEGRALLQDTNQAALQPENLETEAEAAGEVLQDTAADIARQPDMAQAELDAAVTSLLQMGEDITDEDREAVVQVLVARTDLTEQEARDTLNRWEQTFAQVRTDAEEAVRAAGQAVADTISAIAGAVFAVMIVGVFAAGAGGLLGSPEPEEMVRVETNY